MRAFLRFAEKVFTVLSLLLFSGAVLAVLRQTGNTADAEGDPLFQVIWFGIYGITLCLLAVHWRGFTRIPKNIDIPVLLLTGVAIFSFFWSAAPPVTLRRGIALIGTNLFGIYMATRYSPREQLRLLAWTFGIGALLSFLFGLVLPNLAIQGGLWRGVYVQKNSLGRMMTLASLVFLLIAPSSHRYRWVLWVGFGLSAALILLSSSKTCLIVLLTLLILLPFYRALRWRYTRSMPLYIIAIVLCAGFAIWFTSEAETVLGAMGKSVTLSGRTQLWEAVFTMIQQQPWLGYGYSAFWLGLQGYSAYVVEASWQATHAHNGLLDLWLDLGLLGVLVFILSFLTSLVKAVAWVRHAQTLEDFWPLVYLTIMFLFNMTYSTILTRNDIFWIIYVAINFWKPVQHYATKLPVGTIANKVNKVNKEGWVKNV